MQDTQDRQIVLDTETTGFDPKSGHRLVEIGCVELFNYVPSGRNFHVYINPLRDMPQGAFRVHGLSAEFLSKFDPFEKVVKDFLAFIQGAPLVIHNARFDMSFIQYELEKAGQCALKNPVIDTLGMAKQKFPGAPASLDMLCKRFRIDTSKRTKHGALLDAELLAAVYLELKGGLQPSLGLHYQKTHLSEQSKDQVACENIEVDKKGQSPQKRRLFPIQAEEEEAHQKIMSTLKRA